MKLMLTSFDLARDASAEEPSMFHRMPPVSFAGSDHAFAPDFGCLIAADNLIVDEMSFDVLAHNAHPAYKTVAETIRLLHEGGFVTLVDFEKILREEQEVLGYMLEQDLAAPGRWGRAVR